MSEKKFKIEISKLMLVFFILFGLCIMIWVFIIGIWVGTKISEKSEKIIFHEYELTPMEPAYPQKKSLSSFEQIKRKPEENFKKKKKEEKLKYQRKEVAKIAEKIKKSKEIVPPVSFYSIQIGSFSKKEFAKKLKELANNKGYECFIKEAEIKDKKVYRVYIGKYSNRTEAQKHLKEVSKIFKVSKPLLVELR